MTTTNRKNMTTTNQKYFPIFLQPSNYKFGKMTNMYKSGVVETTKNPPQDLKLAKYKTTPHIPLASFGSTPEKLQEFLHFYFWPKIPMPNSIIEKKHQSIETE